MWIEKNLYWKNNWWQCQKLLSHNNQHISYCKTGKSTCKFPWDIFSWGIKNKFLKELCFCIENRAIVPTKLCGGILTGNDSCTNVYYSNCNSYYISLKQVVYDFVFVSIFCTD